MRRQMRLILTAIVSGTVTYSAGTYMFKNASGEVIESCSEAELKEILEGIDDIDISAIKGSALEEAIEGSVDAVKSTGNINHGGRIISDDITEFVSEVDGRVAKDGFGKLSDKSFTVTQKGIDRVKNHISSNGFDAYENTEMIKRIENALKNGESISGADASFYMHELKESALMQSGMPYEEAHGAALDFFEVSDYSVYHPDVIKMEPLEWNSA